LYELAITLAIDDLKLVVGYTIKLALMLISQISLFFNSGLRRPRAGHAGMEVAQVRGGISEKGGLPCGNAEVV
jgi:hypothetical protein